MLLREVAEALSRVQRGLVQHNLSLKVYDCYRPRRAVRAFESWVREPGLDPALKRYHPGLEKSQLIDLGYIAAVSSHSRGDTVDLTLVLLPARKGRPFKASAAYGSCAGPRKTRAPDDSVDMGTSFDCFDPLSHTKAPGLEERQQRWREQLLEAMAEQGFHNYRKEWWHFTYEPPLLRPAYCAALTLALPEAEAGGSRARLSGVLPRRPFSPSSASFAQHLRGVVRGSRVARAHARRYGALKCEPAWLEVGHVDAVGSVGGCLRGRACVHGAPGRPRAGCLLHLGPAATMLARMLRAARLHAVLPGDLRQSLHRSLPHALQAKRLPGPAG
jgi:D-alanyl-D-alanine dipeptidase